MARSGWWVWVLGVWLSLSGLALADSTALEGDTWHVDALLNAKGQMVKVLAGTTLTLQFNAAKLSGNAGCNSFAGSYKRSGSSLSLSLQVRTLRDCGQEVSAQESALMADLRQVTRYELRERRASLLLGVGKPAVLLTRLEPPSLTGVTWELLSLLDTKGGLSAIEAGSSISARFGSDGRLSGSAGCNTYVANYVTSDESLDISSASTTRRKCANAAWMAQESRYLKALERVTGFRLEDGQLRLLAENGSVLAVFKSKP